MKKLLSTNGTSNSNSNSNSQGKCASNNASGSVPSVKRRKLRKLSLSSWEQSNSVELLLYTNPLMVTNILMIVFDFSFYYFSFNLFRYASLFFPLILFLAALQL